MRAEERRPEEDAGSWEDRVAFARVAGGFAYRRRELLVPTRQERAALDLLREVGLEPEVLGEASDVTVLRFGPEVDVLDAVAELRLGGVAAQPDHVLFADCCRGCCGPHPAASGAWAPWANPFSANSFSANPFSANPFSANPFSANPFSANPFSANPAGGNPVEVGGSATGRRSSSARPVAPPSDDSTWTAKQPGQDAPVVAVLDTGMAGPDQRSPFLAHCAPGEHDPYEADVPDLDRDDQLDPVAGHGVFIAGVIGQVAPRCRVRVVGVISNLGDATESAVCAALRELEGEVDVVNLSFSGYGEADQMPALARAVRRLQNTPRLRDGRPRWPDGSGAVVVASAGNEGTCRAPLPAALPHVVSVAALGPGGPAPFTNHGPWVRACAPGVDVLSTFFTDFDGSAQGSPQDPDRFQGWARWSGTSFAAPVVAARIAALSEARDWSPRRAAAWLLEVPGAATLPGLGTVVTP